MSFESMRRSLDRLRAAGYRAQFVAHPGGLAVAGTERVFSPEDLVVDEVVRFEGVSNPDDEAAIFALRAADGSLKGTYTVPYGPMMGARDAETARRLTVAPKR